MKSIIAALLVASSISMTADLPPAARPAYGMPLIGLLELAAAGLLSAWLFFSMWGKNRGK